MWELHRVLNTSKGMDIASILQYTHPLKIATAMEIMYGSSSFVTDGMSLIFYLQRGMDVNDFQDFLLSTTKGR